MMRSGPGKRILYAGLFVVVVGISSLSFLYVRHLRDTNKSSAVRLMIVTSNGGNCLKTCNHPRYTIYGDGTFEGHSALAKSEIARLRSIISDNSLPNVPVTSNPVACQSAVDGSDVAVIFPGRYDDKLFILCQYDPVAAADTFGYIAKLIDAH